MGGRSRKSILKQKMLKYYRERENPLALIALQDEVIRLNQPKFDTLQRNIDYLKNIEKEENEKIPVSKLKIRKFPNEPDKKFTTRAFYEALYPITLEYRFMPIQAIFVWYIRALETVYGEKIPKIHLNRFQKWIKYWLSCLTPEQELQLKSAVISWILNRFT